MDERQYFDAAREWIEGDPDPVTRDELAALVAAGDGTEVAERMHGSLQFGTAGIRGIVAAGSNRMNRAVIIRTSRGLADHMIAAGGAGGPGLLVLGFDGRLSSREFAEAAIGVFAAAGIEVRYFPDPTPTPLVSYAAHVLGASAAVVITASHNPPEYNGYKVYAPNSAQIVPPTDTEIAAAIDRVGPANGVPRAADPWSAPGVLAVASEVVERYYDDVLALRPADAGAAGIAITYTPLHGVGRRFVVEALDRAGYPDVHVVAEQAEPDGRFPTVNFPNPEEPGALDLALDLAVRTAADLIVANDPDADRLAVCVPTPDGGWRQLSGNEVGVLLADYVLEYGPPPATPLLVNSIVSSPMLGSIAAGRGARFEQTLTGFKWICNAALDLEEATGAGFVFGYEEALGYSIGPVVRDKDGISAVVWFADLASRAKAAGSTVLERLAALYRAHGLWASIQHSIVRPGSEGAAEIAAAMERIFAAPPDMLGGRRVTAATDFRRGASERPRWLGETPLLALEMGEEARALVRPSGTEPKLKIYVDLRTGLASDEDMEERRALAEKEAADIASELAALLGFD
jgi:phosphomannomutase